jgi:hypothetical protein
VTAAGILKQLNAMKRSIEIKSAELLAYGSELTDTIQRYMIATPMLLDCGRVSTRRFSMSDNRQVLIHHTAKAVIVEKL